MSHWKISKATTLNTALNLLEAQGYPQVLKSRNKTFLFWWLQISSSESLGLISATKNVQDRFCVDFSIAPFNLIIMKIGKTLLTV